ncbi:hypothetical protein BTVI_31628 [Pitangus sulphuratus]|nr:hypothetical protein BTVI_31628 [Pitangus sulphuratus]
MLGVTRLEHSLIEKDLVDTKLSVSHQCAPEAKAASSILGCIRRRIAKRSREGILALCSALVRPRLECSAGLSSTRVERILQRATKAMKGLEHLSCEERLRELGLFSLEKAQGDLINVYLRQSAEKTEPGSFQWCPLTGPEAIDTN